MEKLHIPPEQGSPFGGGSAADVYLPARKVWERYGVSSMTIHRWIRDEQMAFPSPVYFGRFRYWKISDLIAWERQRAAKGAPDARAA